jgi:2-polyprenyl-3-methyl-5-hydroxy-6-metoxy-1,4-benzoquinol methylase
VDSKAHWERVYQTRPTTEVSWYQPFPVVSLNLIRDLVPVDAHVLDVGGGASTLVDALLEAGFGQLSVLDVAAEALAAAHSRLGARAAEVTWLEADITQAALPARHYDLWHDRAVFHFLKTPEARSHYIRTAQTSLKPGAHLIVATFALDGPTHCSGLEVQRYSLEALRDTFSEHFDPVAHTHETHLTPTGKPQSFIYYVCRLKPTV